VNLAPDPLREELASLAAGAGAGSVLFSRGMLGAWGVELAREAAAEAGVSVALWGGAQRTSRVAAAFHVGEPPSPGGFPLVCLKAVFVNPYVEDRLRVILRALRDAGVEDDAVGDLFEANGDWSIFLRIPGDDLQFVPLDSREVRFEPHTRPWPEPALRQSRVVNSTVSSLRVDSLLSAAFKPSRSQMSKLAEAALVFINGRRISKKNVFLKEGDRAVARGYGALNVLAVSGETRKGRKRVSIEVFLER